MFLVDWAVADQVWQDYPQVVAAWAFGSGQNGQVKAGSDLDIGLLLAHVPTLDERLDLMWALQRAFSMVEVDVVVLNGCSSVLRFEAVSGRVLFCRDMEHLATFVSLTAREYEDDMALFGRGLALYRAMAGQQS